LHLVLQHPSHHLARSSISNWTITKLQDEYIVLSTKQNTARLYFS
jgi:hypothetical protein